MTRASSAVLSNHSLFAVDPTSQSYKHQYSNIYFVRLQHLKTAVEATATDRWCHVTGSPKLVPRVLDVLKGQICYIIGTVYIEMPLKPNVLDDISRDRSIPSHQVQDKFYSDGDAVMLEDESGRIRLIGDGLKCADLVTGVIVGVLGTETSSGDFEVVDLCFADLAPQATSRDSEDGFNDVSPCDNWVAVVSGLSLGEENITQDAVGALAEYLTGEAGGSEEVASSTRVSRLIVAGNSLLPVGTLPPAGGGLDSAQDAMENKPRRYGYDGSNFSSRPVNTLSEHLLDIAQSMPVHILPGPDDPSGTILPQQPFPRAMFGPLTSIDTFSCETNPAFFTFYPLSGRTNSTPVSTASCTVLAHSGQPLNDMFKYVRTPPSTRLSLAESTLRWRHIAPTAPDTLWCHPYFTGDPFILDSAPDIYIIGNQPRFETTQISDSTGTTRCRIILVPSFAQTGQLVLVNTTTLAVETVRFSIEPGLLSS